MWFYPVVLLVVALCIVGASLAGGVFTIVLVPVAVSAVVYALWGRSLEGSHGVSTDATHLSTEPLPHRRRRPSGRAPSSPQRLADARRQQQ
jgi:uncharacterized membrane protein